jgi:hypothetical protein
MARVDLNVPFSEKDEAKQLGARWDASAKVWYVPDGVDHRAFQQWLPDEPDITVRAISYSIAQAEETCWKCGELTRVYSFLLPAGHETFEPGEDDDEPDTWQAHEWVSMVSYVTDLLPSIAVRIKALTPHYYLDFSMTTNSSYWMNHCEHCGIKQGDFAMHNEPGGAFFPMDEEAVAGIRLQHVAEPFSCNGSTSYDSLLNDSCDGAHRRGG